MVGGVNWVDSGYSFPATNEWHHVTMIRSNGVIQFYADGVRTLNTSTKVPSTPTAFSIGSVTGQRFFRGSIDEVRIYNRVLSANDVALISDGPPYIVQSPSNLVVCPATACIFTAVAGSHFPVYQWQKNGVNLSNGGQISGAGTTALTLSSVSPNDAGSYSVLVTNSYGSVLSPSGTLIVSSRPARITPTVVNGFVVGGTIIDGGCGYTQVPTLTFIGTNQTPPGGYVQITNGSVAGLVMTNPGFACSAAMQILVQPPIYSTMTYTHSITNVPGAAATPQVVNGYIVGATVTASGTGYQTPPPVSFNDATGFGAAAIAQINSLGAVTNISITHPGFGYTANASITIAALPLSDVIIPGAADVMVGQSYQLQDTLTLTNWSPVGTTFTATNTVWSATNFWPLQNATNLFFRLYQLP